jgi:hypothetical protein
MSNSAAGTVTAPVDGIAWLLRKAGVPVPAAPVGGSDWMEQKGLLAQPKNRNAGLLGEAVGGVLPIVAAAKAPQIAKGLLQMGENAAKPSTLRNVSQRGIFGGELAQTADKAALAKAKALEGSGADQRAIWKETGWFKGGDGKWRFEIDDSAAAIRNSNTSNPSIFADLIDEAASREAGVSMGNALDHKGLFKAYPSTQATRFKVGGPPGGALEGKTVRVADPYSVPGGQDTRSVVLHELQHAIQQREGFAIGGSPEAMRQEALAMLRRDVASGAIPDTAEAMRMLPMAQQNAYQRLAGEAEARAVQARMNLTPAQRRALFPLDSYDVPLNSLIYKHE